MCERLESEGFAVVFGFVTAIHSPEPRQQHHGANLGLGLGTHHQLCGGVFCGGFRVASGVVGAAKSGLGGGQGIGRDDGGHCFIDCV